MNGLTREEELAALIAEQEHDMLYGDRIDYSPTLSLDAPLSHDHDAGTFSELIGSEDVELEELIGPSSGSDIRLVKVRRNFVTRDEVASWRWARSRRRWTLKQISEHFGRPLTTVHYHLSKPWRRESQPMDYLEYRIEFIKRAYERGAKLMDLAEELYQDAGYSSPGACRNSILFLFSIHNIPRRPRRWKHGLRSTTATIEQTRQYRNEKNAQLRAQGLTTTRRPMRRCPAETREGRRCRRLAIDGSDYCVVHGLPHPTRKWSREAVVRAMQEWQEKHGQGPRTSDWTRATDGHPSIGSVYALFGSWSNALDQAGVRCPPRRVGKDESGKFVSLRSAA